MRRFSKPIIKVKPDDRYIATARVKKTDRFFKLPKEVENFIQHVNQEHDGVAHAKPWTTNRAVTVFFHDGRHFVISYESIFQRPSKMLDLVHHFRRTGIPVMSTLNEVTLPMPLDVV